MLCNMVLFKHWTIMRNEHCIDLSTNAIGMNIAMMIHVAIVWLLYKLMLPRQIYLFRFVLFVKHVQRRNEQQHVARYENNMQFFCYGAMCAKMLKLINKRITRAISSGWPLEKPLIRFAQMSNLQCQQMTLWKSYRLSQTHHTDYHNMQHAYDCVDAVSFAYAWFADALLLLGLLMLGLLCLLCLCLVCLWMVCLCLACLRLVCFWLVRLCVACVCFVWFAYACLVCKFVGAHMNFLQNKLSCRCMLCRYCGSQWCASPTIMFDAFGKIISSF